MKLCFWKRKPQQMSNQKWDAVSGVESMASDAIKRAEGGIARLRGDIQCAIEAAGNDRNRASVKRMLAILEGALEK